MAQDITALEPLIREGCTLLTPNHRLARRIKAQWDEDRAAAGERAWQPLPVESLEPWLLDRWEQAIGLGLLPPVVPLGTAQTLELWRQVISTQQRHSTDYHLLLPDAAAEIAHQARETLRRWQVDMRDPRVRQVFSQDQDCDTFSQWLRAFEQRLKKSGLCTPVDCLAQLSTTAVPLPAQRVVLVGFDDIPPLLRSALEAVSTQIEVVHPTHAVANRLIHPFSDERAELQAVAAWAAALHLADPITTIGIVPADMASDRVALEYLLRREFDCLGENYNSLPVNFSVGIPLNQAPLVRDALAALSMGLSHIATTAVVNLLHSRFLDVQDAHSAVPQRFINRLYAAGRETVAIAELRAAARDCAVEGQNGMRLGRHLHTLSTLRELRRAAAPSEWITHFGSILIVWGWPRHQALDSVEHQQVELWYRTLDEFRSFDAVCGAIHYGEALALLRDCCARQVSHPQTADSPIQVLGPLEAAGLSFDHLWLCGMQAASWPASPRPNPFIPISLQTRLRMPHADAEREQAFCAAQLNQYLRSSQTLHASYARQIDGVPDTSSALLHDFVTQVVPESQLIASAWMAGDAEAALEEVTDHTAPRLAPTQLSAVAGGSRLVEDQSHCPFRAFARHRLRIAPLAEFNAALSAGERGSLLHAALYNLWRELGDRARLHTMNAEEQEQAVVEAVETALASVSTRTRLSISAGYWRLEQQRLVGLLREWLEVECERGDFSVIAREQEFALELAGLQLRLRVDRIDQLPDGSRVIIDYKSGDCSVRDWLGDRPARPQLLLYAIAEPGAVAALAFARVSPRDCRYIGLGQVAAAKGIHTDFPRAVNALMEAGDWDSLNERWRNNLERLALAFAAGEAQVDPLSASSCDHCGLQPFCRVDISRAAASHVGREEGAQ